MRSTKIALFVIFFTSVGIQASCVQLLHDILIKYDTASKYRKTLVDFQNELQAAHKHHPGYFAKSLKTEKTVYRIDSRSPKEIILDGGFWPDPKNKIGTLYEHLGGGGGYVSCSYESIIEELLKDPFFFESGIPVQLIFKNGEIEEVSSSSYKLINKELKNSNPVYQKYNDVSHVIRQTYEYRMHEVEGVRRGNMGQALWEKEVVTRGVDLINESHNPRFRVISIQIPVNAKSGQLDLDSSYYDNINFFYDDEWKMLDFKSR